MSRTVLDVGASAIDESSQLQGELNHADALRTTYDRQHKYGLNPLDYWKPTERHGRVAMLSYWGDHLQLPPVPASSSMLSLLQGTSNEHKAGVAIFRNADLVFRFEKMMRFTDEVLVDMLEVMRTPKPGKAITNAHWTKTSRHRRRCCTARCSSRLVPDLLLLEYDESRVVCLGAACSARS